MRRIAPPPARRAMASPRPPPTAGAGRAGARRGAAPPPQPRRDPALSRGRPGAQRRSRRWRRDAHLYQRRRRRGRPHRDPPGHGADELPLRAAHRMGRRRADRDIHSGVAMVNAQVVPGALSLDAGALATRTAGDGRAIGVTDPTRRSTSIASMPGRRFRPMPARSRSTPPTGSATSRSTTTASPARSTTISTAPPRTAPPPASAWRPGAAAVRLDGRRRLCPRGFGRPLRQAFRGHLCPRRRGRAAQLDARRHRRRRL